jgi:hypothetical protein
LFSSNPTQQTTLSKKDVEQLSNAIEWAAKCNRDSAGKCHNNSGNMKGFGDSAIISAAQDLLPAVINKKYPLASPEQQTKMYEQVMKETVIDVKNLQWISFMPFLMIAVAAVTAGIGLFAAPAALGTSLASSGGITGTVAAETGAGSLVKVGSGFLTKKPSNEAEARKQLTILFTTLKQVTKQQ